MNLIILLILIGCELIIDYIHCILNAVDGHLKHSEKYKLVYRKKSNQKVCVLKIIFNWSVGCFD